MGAAVAIAAEREASKPLDGSDLRTFDQAFAEVLRLRSTIAELRGGSVGTAAADAVAPTEAVKPLVKQTPMKAPRSTGVISSTTPTHGGRYHYAARVRRTKQERMDAMEASATPSTSVPAASPSSASSSSSSSSNNAAANDASVEALMKRLGLVQYHALVLELGADTLHHLCYLERSDLFGIPELQARRLMKEVELLKQRLQQLPQ